jgi:glycosyltransferase involved in cell wall biosynthesis
MRILYVLHEFPKLSESFITNEIYELNRRGHDIAVFSITRPSDKIFHTETEALDIPIRYGSTPSPSLLVTELRRVLTFRLFKRGLFLDDPIHHAYWLHLGLEILDFIDDYGGVDQIHTHFAAPNRQGAVYAAGHHRVPCTVTAHSYEIFSPPSRRRLRRLCSRFDHIVVPSEYNRDYLRRKFGIKTDISVVPATTRVDKFEPSHGSVPGRVLSVARLVEKKGHEYAIDAVAQLHDQGYEVEYHIIGTGPREDILRARVRERGITDAVTFLGNVTDERLKTELHDAALFVLPCVIASDGDRDVAPVAIKEAMAAQTACISTNISAIPELITHGHDGLLVESRDTDALAAAMGQLLDDPIQRRRIAANGRETVQNKFDISSSVGTLLDVFERVQRDSHCPRSVFDRILTRIGLDTG